LRTLQEQTQQHVNIIASRALRDLADADLETQIAKIFVQRLRDLDDEARAAMFPEDKDRSEALEVRSAFELSDDIRDQIGQTLEQFGQSSSAVHFRTVSDLMSGIELSANGQKIEWTLRSYVESLEQEWSSVLQQHLTA
jgi:F-type H+-transporting ATPase subunit b